MRVILFGATGMVGQGVLRECLLDRDVERVLAVTRRATGQRHEKLGEIICRDFSDFSPLADELTGYDACFFCLGVSAAGMREKDYARITYGITIAAARPLAARNPGLTFIYVSGAGADSTERGLFMWARVKGRTENELLRLPFKAAYMFRPAVIQPRHGAVPSARLTRALYAAIGPLFPLGKALLPAYFTTTEIVGRAMLETVRRQPVGRVVENRAINELGAAPPI